MSAPQRSVGFLTATSIVSLLVGWFASRTIHASLTPSVSPGKESAVVSTSGVNLAAPTDGNRPSLTERIDEVGQQLAKIASGTETTMVIYAFAETLRPDEFQAAIATAASSTAFRGAQNSLFGYWMERDLDNALAWYESLDPSARGNFSASLLDTWSAMDPRASLAWLEKQPEESRKSLISIWQSRIASRIGPLEPDRVLALLSSVAGDSGMIGRIRDGTHTQTGGNLSGVATFFSALAAKAPADAAARAMKLPSGTNRTSAALSVAKAWAKNDPAAAKAWAEKIDDAALAAQVIPACAIGLAQTDPKQAAEWLGELAATLPNREAMREVMATWGQKDLEEALTWLDQLPKESGAAELTGAVFNKLAERDPERMIRVLKQRLDDGKALDGEWQELSLFTYAYSRGFKEALRIAETDFQHANSPASLKIYRSLVNGAAENNATETAAWALRQPAGARRRAALQLCVPSMLKGDRDEAFRWIEALPRDLDSDEARLDAARRFLNKEPEKAGVLFAGVTDRESADNELKNSVYWGLRGNRPGYAEWFEKTTTLNAAQKAEIRAELNKPK